MKFLLFSKALAHLSLADLAEFGVRVGADGYDLCVRSGHHVEPDRVATDLPRVAEALARGLSVGMVSAQPNFTDPQAPLAERAVWAMGQAGVLLLKIGYFPFDAGKPYAESIEAARQRLVGWADLAEKYGITIAYHSHAHYLGCSAGGLTHLLSGFDASRVIAYLDPAQLLLQGEAFPMAAAMLSGQIAAIGLKDVLITREPTGIHGRIANRWVKPGLGMVDWTQVADTLRRVAFKGILSAHVLMHETSGTPESRLDEAAEEVQFYRQLFKES